METSRRHRTDDIHRQHCRRVPPRAILLVPTSPPELGAALSNPVARPASTVVLLRPSPSRFDVFLVRRADSVAFMGGAHVFPGGSVDPGDRLVDPNAACDGVEAAIARMPDVDPGTAIAHHVAAIRELFEEAGVQLARGPAGAKRLALDALAYFAHWVTPDIEIKRFDARFFAALVPEGQEPSHDSREASASGWFDPTDAVARCRAGEIALPPPTWTTLRTLERFSSRRRRDGMGTGAHGHTRAAGIHCARR